MKQRMTVQETIDFLNAIPDQHKDKKLIILGPDPLNPKDFLFVTNATPDLTPKMVWIQGN